MNFDEGVPPDSIKEKLYIAKQVDTSISILDSPENNLVLESLLYLSKYADLKLKNLTYLQQKEITLKILNLLDRNIYILRLVLRLLVVFLENTSIIYELDQDIYDDKILEITNFFTTTEDMFVQEFCLDILWRLAKSCRITCLIFKTNIFNTFLETFRNPSSLKLLTSAFNFLNYILDSEAALGVLLVSPVFDIKALIDFLSNEDVFLASKAYEIITKMTSKDITSFQRRLRENGLVELMIEVVMKPDQKAFHEKAFGIIQNCVNSEETCTYFVKSCPFLLFCQWVKDCKDVYLYSCADIFEKLSSIPSNIQILYDFSVEESIISFLRSDEKAVLNKACKAISNLTVHTYCCADMFTPSLINNLVDILQRKDDNIDPNNEVALETIYCFFVRSIEVLPDLQGSKIIPILLKNFLKPKRISENSFSMVLDILYKYSLFSEYQKSIMGEAFFEKLLTTAFSDTDDLAALSLEALLHFIGYKSLNNLILHMNGPKLLLVRLKLTSDTKLIKFILLFIHSSIFYEELLTEFLRNDVIVALKDLKPSFLCEAPVLQSIRSLTYNLNLPFKFYKTGKIDLTSKLGHKFYIRRDRLSSSFPFLEIMEFQKTSPISTVYIVDYTYEAKKNSGSNILVKTKVKKRRRQKSEEHMKYPDNAKFYGEIGPDPYLPYYIRYVADSFEEAWSLEKKISFLAKYIDDLLSGPSENVNISGKIQSFRHHLKSLKFKLGTSIIPIGFLRAGFQCERALVFKAIADRVNIPCSLERSNTLYWNEVALLDTVQGATVLKFYVVDLMNDVGALLSTNSTESNRYFNDFHVHVNIK